jgi:hypothetical protein
VGGALAHVFPLDLLLLTPMRREEKRKNIFWTLQKPQTKAIPLRISDKKSWIAEVNRQFARDGFRYTYKRIRVESRVVT